MNKKAYIKILDAVGYEKDKDQSYEELIGVAHMSTLSDILEDNEDELKRVIEIMKDKAPSKEDIASVQKHMKSKEYQEKFTENITTLLSKMMEKLVPTLDEDQKDSLQKVLQEIQNEYDGESQED